MIAKFSPQLQKELEKMDFTFNVGGKDNQEKYDIKLQDLNRKQ